MKSNLEILDFIKTIWDYPRSITGEGTRLTLAAIKCHLPNLKIHRVRSGTKFWDWKIPDEWKLTRGRLIDPSGNVLLDSNSNPLHIVNYSMSFKGYVELNQLQKHLFSIPELPEAIPYRTSYYQRNWGFCLRHLDREKLKRGKYFVDIEASHFKGKMSLGEAFFKGESRKEIVFSTYICHPNLANNELSGPGIALALANYVIEKPRYYSYRFLFLPETIGSLYFLYKNIESMQKNCLAGYVLTCLGDNRTWSFMPSRTGITLADKIAKRVLNNLNLKYTEYSFFDRGSDERQYCSPRVDLPFCSVMRSKYGTFREYHNSLDNLDLISHGGLNESFAFYGELIREFERNRVPFSNHFGEPMYSKRKIRNTLGGGKLDKTEKLISDFVAMSDGENDTKELSKLLGISNHKTSALLEDLVKKELVKRL